ncbi:hypothetical protein H7B90_25550, partial [Cohnella xylanilytica]|nr:hypothetical protein [Cohnella xylanilytica]
GSASAGAAAAGTGAASARPDAAWIGRFLQWLGVEHERQTLLLHGDAAGHAAGSAGLGGDAGTNADVERAGDTLKSALLTLAASDDLPAPLREAAQGLAGQITGQQLLLSPERQNMALMSHMTLFVPMKGPDGDTTATIHVQTRRGRKGEWDADNCRLLFDLKMKNLGDTIVDVHVVDKVVSLRLLNDRPWVAELVEAARDEAAAGLGAAGYQLLSLKTVPFPASSAADPSSGDKGAAASGGPIDRLASDAYAAKPYKGVDYRA